MSKLGEEGAVRILTLSKSAHLRSSIVSVGRKEFQLDKTYRFKEFGIAGLVQCLCSSSSSRTIVLEVNG